MKVPVYPQDIVAKKIDKISKLLSKQLTSDLSGLSKSKELLAKILGYNDYHDLNACLKKYDQSFFAKPAEIMLIIGENVKSNPAISDIPNIHSIATSLPFHGLLVFKLESIKPLFSPLHPELVERISYVVRSEIFSAVAKNISEEKKGFFKEGFETLTKLSIVDYITQSGAFNSIKNQVLETASTFLENDGDHDWVVDHLARINKTAAKKVLEVLLDKECQQEIINLATNEFDKAAQLHLSSAFIVDHKCRSIEESSEDWSCEIWFPERFKSWNYIEKELPTPDQDDYDCDEEDDGLHIHLRKKLNHGHTLEFFAEPVPDSFYEGLKFHNWVAKVSNKDGIIVTQANGTCYKIDEDSTGGDLIYTSDMHSDTDVENATEFLESLREDNPEYEGMPLGSIDLGDLGGQLVFVQGLQKNHLIQGEETYSGARFLPCVLDLMAEAFDSTPFVIYRIKPDNLINEEYMPEFVLGRVTVASARIDYAILVAIENHNLYECSAIYGGERVYSQMETIMKIGGLHAGLI